MFNVSIAFNTETVDRSLTRVRHFISVARHNSYFHKCLSRLMLSLNDTFLNFYDVGKLFLFNKNS